MKDYIEREKLLQDISETVLFTIRGGVKTPTPEMRGANKVIDRIKSAKAADVVEVRHGVWRSKTLLGTIIGECSECKSLGDQTWIYCPHCGAKMDGKGEGE